MPLNPKAPPPGYTAGQFWAPGYVGDVQDTFDSRHYLIPVGYFTCPYDAAQHFKARAVVPGSRNPETGFQASFIAILGIPGPLSYNPDGTPRLFDAQGQCTLLLEIDPREDWDPFTDDECRQYGHALEALDRASMLDPIDGDVEVRTVAGVGNRGVIPAAASRVKGGGTAGASRRRTQIGGTGVEALKRRNAAGTNEAIADIARTRAEQDTAVEADATA